MPDIEFQVTITFTDRAPNKSDIACIETKPTRREVTYAEYYDQSGKFRFHRNDIALVNVWQGNKHVSQNSVEPGLDGFKADPEIYMFLTPEVTRELKRLNDRVLDAGKDWSDLLAALRVR